MGRGKWDFKADEWTDVATKQSKQSRNTANLETTKENKKKGWIYLPHFKRRQRLRQKAFWKHSVTKKMNNRLHAFSSRWTWKIPDYLFIFSPPKNADASRWLPVRCNQRARCSQLASSCKQSVECCGSTLTVMTDTPAVVLLSLGPVLKCFLIFPATDSWCSFSNTPSSWKLQTKLQQPPTSAIFSQFSMHTGERYLHWPTGDPAPARRCTSDPLRPAAFLWSGPEDNVKKISSDFMGYWCMCKRQILLFDVDTNLGGVRNIVPVRSREFIQALQNLFKESLLIFTSAVDIKATGINSAQSKVHIIVSGVVWLQIFKGPILYPYYMVELHCTISY